MQQENKEENKKQEKKKIDEERKKFEKERDELEKRDKLAKKILLKNNEGKSLEVFGIEIEWHYALLFLL